jgi:hypothetical protein
MSIFAIIAHKRPDLLAAKIEEIYPDNYVFPPSAWLVSDTITTAEVREKLNLTDGKLGSEALIVLVGGWAGYGPMDAWEWFKAKS